MFSPKCNKSISSIKFIFCIKSSKNMRINNRKSRQHKTSRISGFVENRGIESKRVRNSTRFQNVYLSLHMNQYIAIGCPSIYHYIFKYIEKFFIYWDIFPNAVQYKFPYIFVSSGFAGLFLKPVTFLWTDQNAIRSGPCFGETDDASPGDLMF